MPTYTLRTGKGPVNEHGVFLDAKTPTLATEQILTEAVLTFANTGDFAVGETVTEATSSVTGVIYWKTGTRVGIIAASDEFTGGETITGGTSGEVLTPTGVSNILDKTADTPQYSPITGGPHNLSSTGAADPKTVYLNERTTHVMIWQVDGGNILVYNGDANALLTPVPNGEVIEIAVRQRVAKLYLVFDAACTCQVLEADEPFSR